MTSVSSDGAHIEGRAECLDRLAGSPARSTERGGQPTLRGHQLHADILVVPVGAHPAVEGSEKMGACHMEGAIVTINSKLKLSIRAGMGERGEERSGGADGREENRA